MKRLDALKKMMEGFASLYLNDRTLRIAEEVVRVAKKIDRTPSQEAHD